MTALQVAESTAERSELILQPDAVDFLAELHGTFDQRRRDLLAARLEMVAIRAELGEAQWTASHFAAAGTILAELLSAPELSDFLTIPAYAEID